MLCCHGNNQCTQRIIIVAFFIAGVRFSIRGESINNGSQPEILLAPEMDIPVSVLQSKSPLDPQDMHDRPPQLQVTNPGIVEPKTPVVTVLQIPEVEISLSDRDKQNTQQEPHVQEQTTAQTVVEIIHKEPGTERTSTDESEAASSGFPQTEEILGHILETAQDVEYASGNDNTETTWESSRTEVTTEKPHLDTTHANTTSKKNHGTSEDFVQTEVAYDFVSTADVSTNATRNRLVTPSNVTYYEMRNVSDTTVSRHPVSSTTSPLEQLYFSKSTIEHGGYSNNSNDSLVSPETRYSESTEMQNVSTESWHLASTHASDVIVDKQYGDAELGQELTLLQSALTPSSEFVHVSTETTSISSALSSETNSSHLSNSSPTTISTIIHAVVSRGPVQLSEGNMRNNNSQESATTKYLDSSFHFQSTEQIPMSIINATYWPSTSTTLMYHYTSMGNFNDSLSDTNYTYRGHFAHAELYGRNLDSQENVVISGRINPTKSSSDKNDFANDSAQNTQDSDVKQGISESNRPNKQPNDIKSGDNGNKTQDPISSQSDIHKNITEHGQKTSAINLATTYSLQSQWTNNVPELVSSTAVLSETDLPSFSTEIGLESPLDLHNTVVFHGSSPIPLSTIQPSQTLKQQQSKSTETNQMDQPTVTPATESDHILPTVKIPTTYLSMTLKCSWSRFCLHQDDLRNMFARCLSNATRYTIRPSQIVFFNTNVCKHVTYSENEVNDGYINSIVVQMYVANKHGDSSEQLTERLGFVLVKNKMQGFNDKMKLQDVVLAVQLHRKEDHPQLVGALTPNDGSSDMGIIAAITISGIASICLVLLCILLVVLKRRHILKQQRRRCRPVRADAYSLDSISIYSSFYKRKIRASKRSYLNQGFEDPNAPTNKLNFAGLANLSTDENALAEEYKQIPMTMAKLGDLPPGADLKNRYANVIPFPETRVQLPSKEGDPTLGYINANYVRGFRGDQRAYIACQAPLESTVADFWEMVWENQCKVVIMLTDWEEEEVAKCFPYFAESTTMDSHRRFGDYQVTTKKIDTRESFTITSIQLKNLEKNLMRDVLHYWYTAWPSVGVPSERVSIVEMLAVARGAMRAASAPTVVHCSPGTGRTGTVLAIHISMQEYDKSRTVDIPQCVYRLRRDRGGCVQTSEQYKFIYEVLHEFASQIRNPSGRSSIRSSK